MNADNIFWPGIDPGMYRISNESIEPLILNRPVDVSAIIASSGLEHRHHLTDYINRYKKFREFSAGVVFPSIVVAADNIKIRGSMIAIEDKFLINGPAGLRIVTRMSHASNIERQRKLDEVVSSFTERRRENGMALPLLQPTDLDLDFVVVTKNLFNYFHFTRETIPSLTLYQNYNLTGKIVICSKNSTTFGFVHQQIKLFFPELVDRVEFSYGEFASPRALLPLDSRFLYFQSSEACMPALGSIAKVSWMWEDRVLGERSLKTLGMNSCETSLLAFRELVLKKVESKSDPEPQEPLRLYVGRRPSKRLRPVKQEELLIEVLQGIGFKVIYFEDHDVLTQAQLVSKAEVIVMAHGAGMTNMLYAQPGCLVVEISTLQTALLRFGDFNPIALASQARYVHFFIDHDWPNQESIPNFEKFSLVGSKFDGDGISILRSFILAHLDPERHGEKMSMAARLNDESKMEDLSDFLLRHFDSMLHEAHAHVWAANCAAFQKKSEDALRHLMRASRLAPQRQALLERAIILAHRLNADSEFKSLATGYFRYHRDSAILFFEKRDWDATLYLEVPDPDVTTETSGH